MNIQGADEPCVLPGCCQGKFTSEKTPLWFCASGLLANPNVTDLETGPVVRMPASSYVKAILTPLLGRERQSGGAYFGPRKFTRQQTWMISSSE